MIRHHIRLLLSFSLVSAGALPLAALPSALEQLLLPTRQQALLELQSSQTIEPKNIDIRYWISIKTSDKLVRTQILEAGADITEVGKDLTTALASQKAIAELKNRGIVLESQTPLDIYRLNPVKDFPSVDTAYHNYAETHAFLADLASRYPDTASLFSIGKTFEKRDIWCLRLGKTENKKQRTNPAQRPGALFIGNHHAREHLSNEVPLKLAAWLLENRETPEVKTYLETLDIYIIPMLNADGVEYDIQNGNYRRYRKNRSVLPDGNTGVDLNRNYDFLFGGQGTSHSTWADSYCGEKAFSEPESLAVKNFIETRKALTMMVSYHTSGSQILYPWGGTDADVPDLRDKTVFINMAAQMAALTGYEAMKSSDLYIATGDGADWAYEKAKIFAFTVELEGPGFYPGPEAIDTASASNIKAAAYVLSLTADPYKALTP